MTAWLSNIVGIFWTIITGWVRALAVFVRRLCAPVSCSTPTTSEAAGTERGRDGNHVTLGYAATVHSAQGVTADSCYAILGEGASRAMLYVAMTRGRHNNQAFLYQHITNEADHDHTKPIAADGIHIACRDNKYTAAQYFRMLLANDDRPRTMHTEAERTERHLLPQVVGDLLQRHEQRRYTRRAAWNAHLETAEVWRSRSERIAVEAPTRTVGVDIETAGLEM